MLASTPYLAFIVHQFNLAFSILAPAMAGWKSGVDWEEKNPRRLHNSPVRMEERTVVSTYRFHFPRITRNRSCVAVAIHLGVYLDAIAPRCTSLFPACQIRLVTRSTLVVMIDRFQGPIDGCCEKYQRNARVTPLKKLNHPRKYSVEYVT